MANEQSLTYKTCKKCGESKLLSDYFQNRKMKDGHLNVCKVCRTVDDKQRYAANAERIKQKAKEYRDSHPEVVKAQHERQKEKLAACPILKAEHKQYHKEYQQAHAEERQAHNRKWKENHPERYKAYRRKKERVRRHKKRSNGGTFTNAEWMALCARYGNRCLDCLEVTELTVDHIIPVSKGGRNSIENLQPLCNKCNGRKHNRTIIDFRLKWKEVRGDGTFNHYVTNILDNRFIAINGKEYGRPKAKGATV